MDAGQDGYLGPVSAMEHRAAQGQTLSIRELERQNAIAAYVHGVPAHCCRMICRITWGDSLPSSPLKLPRCGAASCASRPTATAIYVWSVTNCRVASNPRQPAPGINTSAQACVVGWISGDWM